MRLRLHHQCAVALLVLVLSFSPGVHSVPVEPAITESSQEDQPQPQVEAEEPKGVETIVDDTEEKLSDPISEEKLGVKEKIEIDESSMADGSKIVEGKYIFIGLDGIPTEVEYEASPEKGFVIKSFKKDKIEPKTLVPSSDDVSEDVPAAEEEVAEEMFPGGFVRGLYTYMDADGVPTTVEYEAAPDIGFVVKNYYKESINNEKLAGTESVKRSTEYVDDRPAKQNEQSPKLKKGITKQIIITPLPSDQSLLKYTPEIDLPVPKYVESKENAATMKLGDSDTKNSDETLQLMLPRSSVKNFRPPKVSNGGDIQEEENDEDSLNSSYRFGFAVDNQSRHEESDSNGNVKGSYSYVGTDGFLTKVDYEAGANKGFVIKKMTHDPMDPSKTSLKPVRKDASTPKLALGKVQTDEAIVSEHDDGTVKSEEPIVNPNLEPPLLDSIIPSESRKSIQVTSLEGIPHTNIEQSYPFSHILTRGNYFQGQHVEPHQSERENGFLMYGIPFPRQVSTDQDAVKEMAERAKHYHNKKKPKHHHSHKTHSHHHKKPNRPTFTKIEPDGSYAFAYKTDDHSREESIDSKGNIHYSYQYKNKRDGSTVVVFNNKVSTVARTEESDAQDVSPNHEIFRVNPGHQESHLLAYPVPNPTVYQPLVNQKLPEEMLYSDDTGHKFVRRIFRRVVSRKYK